MNREDIRRYDFETGYYIEEDDFNSYADEKEKEIQALKEQNERLMEYAQHNKDVCLKGCFKNPMEVPFGNGDKGKYPRYGCTCGLDDLLKENK